jgi:hypothetical protein
MPETELDVDSGWDLPAPDSDAALVSRHDVAKAGSDASEEALFGGHPHFGDTAHKRYLDEGYTPSEYGEAFASQVDKLAPGASRGISFYEKGGRVYPRGFITATALATVRSALPYLDFAEALVTLPAMPRRVPSPGELPAGATPKARVDLRELCSKVGDQGQTARALAFAWTHGLELAAAILEKPFPRLSSSFTMLALQKRQGDFKDFERAYLGGAGGTSEMGPVLFEEGSCRQDLWPDDDAQPRATLEEMQEDAKAHVLSAKLVDLALADLKRALAARCPVVVTMRIDDALVDVGRDGVCRTPTKARGAEGHHAMLCVGHLGDFFVMKSSWGEGWGDGGYCYVPEAMLKEADLTAIVLGAPGADDGWVECPWCAVRTPDARFCTSCGQRLAKPSFCSECGTPLEDTNVCVKCGTTTA